MRSRRCETCRFYEHGYPGGGFCHRPPPKYDVANGSTDFAPVALIMWCGEWKLAWRRFFKLFNRKDQP
jgi:hypothetical protein